MRVLLDTHCWLWMTEAPERFSTASREMIESDASQLFLSAASAWEIAIKCALGKLTLPVRPSEYVETRLQDTRTAPLPISHLHALHVGELPRHHRDPFDRLLIAQAQLERLSILTADPHFQPYDVELIQA